MGRQERISTGEDLSDFHFISQLRVSIEFVTMQQEDGSKNLAWEQFVLILSSTYHPRLDGQTKCVELLCLPHIHVFRLNSILEMRAEEASVMDRGGHLCQVQMDP